MKIIAIVGQKGGPGKTTVAQNLAVEAAAQGETVVLFDLDPQATAAKWSDRRELDNVAVQSVQAARLAHVLKVAKDNGVTLAILDTPGRAADLAIAAARASDLVVVPFRTGIDDIETGPAVRDILTAAGSPRNFAVVNAAQSKGTRHAEARKEIEAYGFDVAPVVLYQRNAYQDAKLEGKAVVEYEPDGKAAQEVRELYRFAAKQMNRQNGKPVNRPRA
jgi:chromosome partitioning protein